MAFDSMGMHHLSPQRARIADQRRGPEKPKHEDDGEHEHPEIHHIEVHPHGDGTHHTVTHFHSGEEEREDHGSLPEVHSKLDEEIGDGEDDHDADDEDGLGDDDGY